MVIPVKVMTDDQLLQNLAIHRENTAIRLEIIAKIGRHIEPSEEDRQLITDAVEKLRQMEEMDSDLIDQSGRCRRLSQEYLEIRNQLLQRMKGEEPAELCTVS